MRVDARSSSRVAALAGWKTAERPPQLRCRARFHGAVVAFAFPIAACGTRACGKLDAERQATFDADHAALVAKNPPAVSFVLRTEGDRKRLALGEEIPLVLRFASTVPGMYELDVGTSDSSGRLESETFRFDPDTVVDPLEHYFEGGRTGGGVRPRVPVLGTKPSEVTIALNEWARFVKPGSYRVFVQSSRIESVGRGATRMGPGATSDVIAFEIVDDPKWTEAELARARSVLAMTAPKPAAEEAATEARRSLRFLNTPGAARAMVDDLCAVDERSRFQSELGVFASPFRRKPDAMREELRARIAAVFATLPDDALARMLESEWSKVRSPAMAPTLLALAKDARPRGGRLRAISDLALERLVELDYEAARTFIVSELGRSEGVRVSFSGKTLGLLKDAELPAVDAALLSGLAAEQHDGATLELRSEVVARYGSKAILDKVWPIYRGEKYFHISLLAYLWRHDRKAAEAEMRTIDDVYSLQRLSARLWNPVLEELLVKRLHAPNASTAATVLAERGSVAAETAIVERWREVHASREDKDGLAQTLRSALVRARGWMITPEKARARRALRRRNVQERPRGDGRPLGRRRQASPARLLEPHRWNGHRVVRPLRHQRRSTTCGAVSSSSPQASRSP
jgi:hypothetical protein